MKEKYIEEVFRPWMIFGESKTEDSVDVANVNFDVINSITRSNAEAIIKERRGIIKALCSLVNALQKHTTDKQFNEIWYDQVSSEYNKLISEIYGE